MKGSLVRSGRGHHRILHIVATVEHVCFIRTGCIMHDRPYTYQRLEFIADGIFITPYLIIMLHLLTLGFTELVGERMLDTAIAFRTRICRQLLPLPELGIEALVTALVRRNQRHTFIYR